MQRKLLSNLNHWRNKKGRTPLIIRGARQVGKTWLVRRHASEYTSYVEINLEEMPEYIKIFKQHYGDPESLIRVISLLSGKKIVPRETLFFIDEVQESKEAILSLRYFKEKLPELHVIAAGSLLEFVLGEISFPVGRVEFIHLFPMNFEEFLLAQGRKDLVEEIKSLKNGEALAENVHALLMKEVKNYFFVGGMPEVVQNYVKDKELSECQSVQQRLVSTFRMDFHKYANKNKIEHLQIVFTSIPRLLGQKFKYSNVDSNIKSRELSSSLRLLEEAGLAYKVYHSSANGLPLMSQIDPLKFKVFFLDVGLCNRILNIPISQLYTEGDLLLNNKGFIAEQFVAQELLSFTPINKSPELFYWQRESKSSKAEIDMIIEYESKVLPIEVKSGSGNKTRSLQIFMDEKNKYVSGGLKISPDNFSQKNGITGVPFYGLMRLCSC